MKFPELDELQTLAGKGLTTASDAATSSVGQGLLAAAAQGLTGLGQRNRGPVNNLGSMFLTGMTAKHFADQTALKKKSNLALLANQQATLKKPTKKLSNSHKIDMLLKKY